VAATLIKELIMSQQIALQQREQAIKSVLAPAHRQIKALCANDDKRAGQFTATALVVATNPALNRCTPTSIVSALLSVATSGLSVDPNLGHAYFVPYGESVQLQIGYKGYIQLAHRAGWMVKSFPVYDVDTYTEESDGWDEKVTFIKNLAARDEGNNKWVFEHLIGVRVAARHADTKDEYALFVPKAIIEKLRKLSSNQKNAHAAPTGIWQNNYAEMAQAKAIKQLIKKLPIGDKRIDDIDERIISNEVINDVSMPVPSVQAQKTMPSQAQAHDDIEDGNFTDAPPGNVDTETGEMLMESEPVSEESEKTTSETVSNLIAKPVINFTEERYLLGALKACKDNKQLVEFWEAVPDELKPKYQAQFNECQDLMR
jgi:recombination protein RecT